MQCISSFIKCSITAITTRDTYQDMMNLQDLRTFAPTVAQPDECVSDADTYTEDDYAHTYQLEPEEHMESVV